MKMRIIIGIFLLLVLVACKKKEYPEDLIIDENASFLTNLTVNGSPLKIEAGKNGYYLYTGYHQDSLGLYHFIGEFKSTDKTNGNKQALKIEITDLNPVPLNSASNIDVFLNTGSYNYYDNSYYSTYGIEFAATYNASSNGYYWDFGDSTSSNEANPIHYFKTNKTYPTCLTINGTNGCSSTNCNIIYLNPGSPNVYVSTTKLADQTLFFHPNIIGGKAPFKYYWTFGDGSSDTASNPKHTYSVKGSYPVTLRITDANQKSIQSNYNAVTANDISSCAGNYIIKSILPEKQNLGQSEITLTYTNENGVVYTTKTKTQKNTSFFTISGVEPYENNELGQKTKKIELQFDCEAFSSAGSIKITSQKSIFCIAYP